MSYNYIIYGYESGTTGDTSGDTFGDFINIKRDYAVLLSRSRRNFNCPPVIEWSKNSVYPSGSLVLNDHIDRCVYKLISTSGDASTVKPTSRFAGGVTTGDGLEWKYVDRIIEQNKIALNSVSAPVETARFDGEYSSNFESWLIQQVYGEDYDTEYSANEKYISWIPMPDGTSGDLPVSTLSEVGLCVLDNQSEYQDSYVLYTTAKCVDSSIFSVGDHVSQDVDDVEGNDDLVVFAINGDTIYITGPNKADVSAGVLYNLSDGKVNTTISSVSVPTFSINNLDEVYPGVSVDVEIAEDQESYVDITHVI